MWIHNFHFKVVAEAFPSGIVMKKTYRGASSPQISSKLCIKSVQNFILFYLISLLFIQYNFIGTGGLILKRECKSNMFAIIWSLSPSFENLKCSLLWHKVLHGNTVTEFKLGSFLLCAINTLVFLICGLSAVARSRSSRATIKRGNLQLQERLLNHLTNAGEQSLWHDSGASAKMATNLWGGGVMPSCETLSMVRLNFSKNIFGCNSWIILLAEMTPLTQ